MYVTTLLASSRSLSQTLGYIAFALHLYFILTPIDGWSLLGGNQFAVPKRLERLGWEPVWSRKLSLLDSMPAAVDEAWKTVE